jgi:L-ascorbate metabolism protein UlaG (beta-lactamase superfamily)
MPISNELRITYIGGPTAVLEVGGLRLLTDPTFDPAPQEYDSGKYMLRKTAGPALYPERLGAIDVVLLSHDHHFDNLDRSGREFLKTAGKVLTTVAGAERLGGNAMGLENWQSLDFPTVRITGTPARHGPAGGDRGPVTGFVLEIGDRPGAIYVSGDTVWYEGTEEVARRFQIRTAILFMGAATVQVAGPNHLTITAEEALQAAKAFHGATIVPLHFEGWAHFTESREFIAETFRKAGQQSRLLWPSAGKAVSI